jgi:glycosidase
VTSQLGYLEDLGVTAIWLEPGVQAASPSRRVLRLGHPGLLDVDPRFGTRRDLVDLVKAAHDRQMRVILDVIFNHSGSKWVYPGGALKLPYSRGYYDFGTWLGRDGAQIAAIGGADDGAWPREVQDPDAYTRAGSANLADDTR